MADSFVNEFIDEYYAECEEHLGVVRSVLLSIEENIDRAPDRARIADVTRAIHTIKGLSGMVGFADAESIAHLIEDWLRGTTVAGAAFSSKTIEGMFEGERLLEATIAAHRAGIAPPDVHAFTTRVRAVTDAATRKPPESGGSIAVASERAPVSSPAMVTPDRSIEAAERAIREGATVYEYNFSPTKELAAAGITVETVRTSLSSRGSILDAAPRMDGGRIAFRFMVSVPAGSEVPAADTAGGLTRQQYVAAPSTTEELVDGRLAAGSVVRVDLARLDELMRLVGEMVITRSRLDDQLSRLEQNRSETVALRDTSASMERQMRDLRDAIMHVRMVPIGEIFDRMRYVAREAGREMDRKVSVELSGQDTEVNKMVVDRMMEPLLHLVRNAVGHGIEPAGERIAKGKDATGILSLRAWTSGERIMIEVRDDGAGADFDAIQSRAHVQALLPENEEVTDANVLDIISSPGFSTRDAVDMTSGRGVGMAVARERIRELGGDITMSSRRDRGTTFLIRLPLTLMIVDAVMFRMNGNLMAVPQPGVIEVLHVAKSDITVFENNEVMKYRERILPLFRLRRVFGMSAAIDDRASNHVLVLGSDNEPIGIIVNRIVGQREIVVRTMTDPLVKVPGISGATELSDGTVALILDTTQLVERAMAARR